MKFLRTEVRIFLVTFFLSLFIFFIMFAVGLPLIFEQRLLSSKFSSSYVLNFLSGMILYFLTVGMLSALVYIFVKNMSPERRIFIIILIANFFAGTWGIMGIAIIGGLYDGKPAYPLWVIGWLAVLGINDNTGYAARFYILLVSALSILAAGMSVLTYRARQVMKKWRRTK